MITLTIIVTLLILVIRAGRTAHVVVDAADAVGGGAARGDRGAVGVLVVVAPSVAATSGWTERGASRGRLLASF